MRVAAVSGLTLAGPICSLKVRFLRGIGSAVWETVLRLMWQCAQGILAKRAWNDGEKG